MLILTSRLSAVYPAGKLVTVKVRLLRSASDALFPGFTVNLARERLDFLNTTSFLFTVVLSATEIEDAATFLISAKDAVAFPASLPSLSSP